jgi:hypothetical protein
MTTAVITWDAGEDFEVSKLQTALELFGLRVYDIDTGSSMYGVLITQETLTQEEAEELFFDESGFL